MLRGGTYRHELSVVFSGSDSGTERAPITYTAYPGERPILTGSRLVTGWQPYRGHIVAAELPTEENFYYRFRQLFYNGPAPDPGAVSGTTIRETRLTVAGRSSMKPSLPHPRHR